MIKVYMTKNGFTILGHAGYAEHGKDIVCASVSTILQLAQMGLEKLALQYPDNIEIVNCKLNIQLNDKWEELDE